MDYSGPPQGETAVPAPITACAAGRPVLPVWVNRSGGTTFQLGDGEGRLFAKWAPAGSGIDLGAEAARLRWAADFTPVPRVLDHGLDAAGQWLVTAGLPGESAVSPRWKADPKAAVRALGAGLRALHDRLPVDECPFSWSVERRRARDPDLDIALAADPALAVPPPVDRLVVCHGDACAPNTLLDEDGRWSAHVDLGALGVADRWADIAIAVWNLDYNYGPGWTDTFYEAYGIAPDPERVAFYRRMGGVSKV
ncbi:aminoglycoside 3'-phosphotransferase [Actinacidiphila bryophytorum]|uniref:Kanamycin kinase n=2 Tax=Actinacidiphila bryophytorum TaxID=1436133 RepID=A0A9W4H4R8_9ACTN|nr:aminoglycoside 3'-phosphotransferase [Actinacidiphila bryophytorum]MBM9435667.1 aminoglycoside 3'-phosphotransferase [Actinacidiphila bryophytorum]CAG7650807.1 Kanamycin kinase [Actinacidiphila bryophytorum]